jgi:predicted ester cyclase
VRWSATATHTGNFFGLAPTQKKVTMIGMTIFRVENGQVAELWDSLGRGRVDEAARGGQVAGRDG